MDTVIFAPDLIEYVSVGVSLSDAKFKIKKSIKMNHATRFTNVCARQINGICAIFNTQKACLKLFCAEMAAIIVAKRRHSREQRSRGRRERIFSTHINLFGKNTLSEHIVCQAMLFLVCFRK